MPFQRRPVPLSGIGSGDPVPPQLLGTWVFSRPDDPSTELELTFTLQGGCQVRERNGSSTSGWTSSYRVSGHEVTVDKMRFILTADGLQTVDGVSLRRKGAAPAVPLPPEAEPGGAAEKVPAAAAP